MRFGDILSSFDVNLVRFVDAAPHRMAGHSCVEDYLATQLRAWSLKNYL